MQDAIIDVESYVVVISDRQKVLTKAILLMLLNVHHSYFLQHLMENLYGVTNDNMGRKYISATAQQFTEVGFQFS